MIICNDYRAVILDEATASVNQETDSKIQNMFKDEFRSCRVMTIAHRLNTIITYDRVMLMESGMIKEIGKPSESSLFYSMINSK